MFEDILFVYGVAGLSMVHMIGFHALLPGGKHSKTAFIILVAIFVLTAIASATADSVGSMSVLAAAAPIISFWLMRTIRLGFIRKYDRLPVDTGLSFEDGLREDRAFNLLVVGAPFLLWSVVFGLIYFFTLSQQVRV